MYCTVKDVYRVAGITLDEISEEDMIEHILDAEVEVDRFTASTWWNQEYTADIASATTKTITITDAGFNKDLYVGSYLWVYSGTGANLELLKITANSETTITVESDFITVPDATSKARIIHTGTNPRREEKRAGDNTPVMFTERGPLIKLVSAVVDGTDVTISNALIDYFCGEIDISDDSATGNWAIGNQKNTLNYWFGFYDSVIDRNAKTLTACYAAISALGEQMGGTHNIPSTYSLPEGSVSIGQAYVNIKGTVDVLRKKTLRAEKSIRKYHTFA